MARTKRTVTQRNFGLGEVREDFLEQKTLEIREASMRRALNVRIAATGVPEARPGTNYRRTLGSAYDVIELRPATGVLFGLVVNNGSLDIIDSEGRLTQTIGGLPWANAADVWVEPFREVTVLGFFGGLFTLTWNGSSFVWANYGFDEAAGSQKAQPYWAYYKDATITPSAKTGAGITITASQAIWSAAYVGALIRYNQQEILITSYVSPTVLIGTVRSTLPPSFQLTLSSTAGISVGDAIIAQDSKWSGLVASVSGANIYVTTIANYAGPNLSEELSAPTVSATVTAKAEIAPVASPLWDEPLMSAARGYPRSGGSAGGRLALADFPQVSDLIAMSSVRAITDFKVGVEDDDAIVRQCGDNAPRFLHVVNSGDLLLFSDRGLYYLPLRDGGFLTPSNFNPILFDKRACSSVRPAQMNDGVVFVEASGESVAVATLGGNIYKKWEVRTISTYHSHLIKTPIKLCGPSLYSEVPEKYLFVVNEDGTLAAMSWFSDFSAESIGFVPWDTQGSFKSISPIFGGYWSIVDRDINGTSRRFLEQLSEDAILDCSVPLTTSANLTVNGANLTVNGAPLLVQVPAGTPLAGATVHVAGDGFYAGTRVVDGGGTVPDTIGLPANSRAGFNFMSRVMPWPVEIVDGGRAGMLKARCIRGSVSVQNTGMFQVRANREYRDFGGYVVGADLSEPPALFTGLHRFSVVGVRDHPEIEVIKHLPGRFKILAITQEVQA